MPESCARSTGVDDCHSRLQRSRRIRSHFAGLKAGSAAAAHVRMDEPIIGSDGRHGVKAPVHGRRTLPLLPRTVADMVAERVLRAQHFADIRQLSLDRRLVFFHEFAHRAGPQASAGARMAPPPTPPTTGSLYALSPRAVAPWSAALAGARAVSCFPGLLAMTRSAAAA